MAIQVTQLPRAFSYNGVELPDIGGDLTPEQVKDVYAATYPEITSAAIEGPEHKGGKLVYTFRRAVGTKGASLCPSPCKLTRLCKRGDGMIYVEVRPAIKVERHPFLKLLSQAGEMMVRGTDRMLGVPYKQGE